HVRAPDGSGEATITAHSPQGAQAVWSPRGGRIAFLAAGLGSLSGEDSLVWHSDQPTSVWAVGADGVGPHRLASIKDPQKVVWSPNGGELAVVDADSKCWVMRADGSHRHVLRGLVDDVAWSPDSRRLAVVDF